MATEAVTLKSWSELTQRPGILLLDWWAEWCTPCRVFAPIFEQASERHPDAMFGKIDTDQERRLAAAFQVTSIPTLMVLRDGVLLFRQAGALPGEAIDEIIAKARALNMDEVRQRIAEQEQRPTTE